MIASQSFIEVSKILTLFIYKGVCIMKKRKVLYKSIITNQGQTDNICPECNGEAVEVGDYEHGHKGIELWPCSLCEGTGIAIENKDFVVNIEYDPDGGKLVEIIPMK